MSIMITKLSEVTETWLQKYGYSSHDLDEQKDNGTTALILACRHNAIDIVRDLLANNVNVNFRNHDGNNALWFACFQNSLPLIELLINAGIDLDNQNDNGVTVLMYAASAGKIDAVRILLTTGANPNLKNLDDFSAVEFSRTIEILNLLRQSRK